VLGGSKGWSKIWVDAVPTAAYPRFVDGALCCPPEDVGSIPGFYEAIGDPKHPDHEDRIDWYGGIFDPEHIDLDRIYKDLGRIAARRQRAAAKRTR